jgi:hypothetical protein
VSYFLCFIICFFIIIGKSSIEYLRNVEWRPSFYNWPFTSIENIFY